MPMWLLAATALVFVGIGCYIMPDDWNKGILLVFFSSILFVLAAVAALLGSFRKGSTTGRGDLPE
jgi:hypothetical protein